MPGVNPSIFWSAREWVVNAIVIGDMLHHVEIRDHLRTELTVDVVHRRLQSQTKSLVIRGQATLCE